MLVDELLGEFAAETLETLEALSGEVVAWEADPTDRHRLDAFFRFFHTVKGSCGFLNLPRLERLSHAAEDVLAAVRTGEHHPDPATITAVLAVMDRIADCARAISADTPLPDEELDDPLLAALADARTGRAPLPAPAVVVESAEDAVEVEPTPLPTPSPTPTPTAAPAITSAPAASPAPAPRDKGLRTIRISLSLIDQLMNGVSDMVLARNELARKLRDSDLHPDVEGSFERLSACVADMRDMVSKTRMQRVDRLFAAIPRMVRDISQELGKKVELVMEGGEVEMDREMIEMVLDPLTHIVRNALDHGLETPAQRVAAGKPETGRVSITARQSGNQIAIEVRDDGRGIDTHALIAKALRLGVVSEAEVAAMAPADKVNLIFHAGLSTAREVSAISGRGVGMDVVRTNVERIGGFVALETVPGQGTWLQLRVPMTLTIIPGLILRCGTDLFAIPRSNVIELLHECSNMVKLENVADAKIATIRGQRHALIDLEDVLERPKLTKPGQSRTLMIIASSSGAPYAMGVDMVENHEELVIRPASPLVMTTGIFAGMTLPDNGRPMLLLDPAGIAEAAGIDLDEYELDRRLADTADEDEDQHVLQAIHFVERGGQDRLIALEVVERIEDIDASAFGTAAGGAAFVRIGEDLVPLANAAPEQREGIVKTLQLRAGGKALCYVVEDVLDIVVMPLSPDLHIDRDGVSGVVLIDGRHFEVVDVHGLFAGVEADKDTRRRSGTCLVEGLSEDPWMRAILAPLLIHAGYDVRDADDAGGSVGVSGQILIRSGDGPGAALPDAPGDIPVLRLRGNPDPAEGGDGPSIYRYDKEGLLATIKDLIRSDAA